MAAGLALFMAGPAAVHGETGGGAATLLDLQARSRTVVLGTARRHESLDDGRLLVHHLDVERPLRGTAAAGEVRVVEIRGATERPPLFAEGERAVVLLTPAPRLTYLAQTLPEGPHHAVVSGRAGVIPLAPGANGADVEAILQSLAEAAELPQGEARRQAVRDAAFAELATQNARLVADALLELRGLPGTFDLTSEEVGLLRRTLENDGLPAPLRARLLALLGERRWAGSAGAIAALPVRDPVVLRALLDARARLGVPADLEEVRRHLASPDPAVRAAAVSALATLDDPAALRELGGYATGADDGMVRAAAIEALGKSGRPEAVPYLTQTFETDDRRIQQASARALVRLPGDLGQDALLALVLADDTSSRSKRYAALLLIASTGGEHAAVERMKVEAQDPAVRELLEHGLKPHHSHDD